MYFVFIGSSNETWWYNREEVTVQREAYELGRALVTDKSRLQQATCWRSYILLLKNISTDCKQEVLYEIFHNLFKIKISYMIKL